MGEMNRRGFGKLIIASAASATLPFLGGCGSHDKKPVATTPVIHPTEHSPPLTQIERWQEILDRTGGIEWNEGGVQVYGIKTDDGSYVPLCWWDRNNERRKYDWPELIEEQKIANETNKPRLITFERIEPISLLGSPQARQEKKKIVEELPKDVLSAEALASRGIEILDSPNTALYIRPGAFAADGLLKDYQIGGKKELLVVLTDSSLLDPAGFQDERYQGYPTLINPDINPYVREFDPAKARAFLLEQFKIHDMNYPVGKSKFYDSLEDKVTALGMISNEEIVRWGLTIGQQGGAGGLHLFVGDKKKYGEEYGLDDKSVIMLPVGGGPGHELYFWVVRIMPKTWFGQEFYTHDYVYHFNLLKLPACAGISQALSPDQSYSSHEDFRLREPVERSKFNPAIVGEDRTKGFILRHEFAHDWKLLNPTGNPIKDYSEWETDMLARETIQRAYEKYQDSGDDSGYYFVFHDKSKGFYVVT